MSKGYPPSVYAKIPQLVERAGNGDGRGGSITAIYTVLVEGDDQYDPIFDAARAILDGHIVLSRRFAESGQYPAIDVEASISRAMSDIVSVEHRAFALRFRQLLSAYERDRDLISVGAYKRGTDARIDEAIDYHPRLVQFLQQDMQQSIHFSQSLNDLKTLMSTGR